MTSIRVPYTLPRKNILQDQNRRLPLHHGCASNARDLWDRREMANTDAALFTHARRGPSTFPRRVHVIKHLIIAKRFPRCSTGVFFRTNFVPRGALIRSRCLMLFRDHASSLLHRLLFTKNVTAYCRRSNQHANEHESSVEWNCTGAIPFYCWLLIIHLHSVVPSAVWPVWFHDWHSFLFTCFPDSAEKIIYCSITF